MLYRRFWSSSLNFFTFWFTTFHVTGEKINCPRNATQISSSYGPGIQRYTLFQLLDGYKDFAKEAINCNLSCESNGFNHRNHSNDSIALNTAGVVYPEHESLHTIDSFIATAENCHQHIRIIIAYQCSKPEIIQLKQTIEHKCEHVKCHCYDLDWYKRPLDVMAKTLYVIFTAVRRNDEKNSYEVLLVLSVMDSLLVLLHFEQMKPLPMAHYTVAIPTIVYDRFVAKEFPSLYISNVLMNEHYTYNVNMRLSLSVMQRMLNCRYPYSPQTRFEQPGNVSHIEYRNKNRKWNFRVVTIIYPPYIVLVENHVPTNNNKVCKIGKPCKVPIKSEEGITKYWEWGCCHGFVLEIFELVVKELGITYDLYIVEDGKFGGLDENGTWNGLIRDLVDNKADVGLHGLIPSQMRMQAVDFTPSLVDTHYVVVLKPKARALATINWEFADGVDVSLAIAVVISVVACSLCVALFQNHGFFMIMDERFPLREVVSYFGGLTFQRDLGGRNPVNWSGRVVALCFAIATTVIMNTYTAFLAASNIKLTGEVDFNGILDNKITNPTDDFKFGAVTSTVAESIIKENLSGHYDGVWDFMKKYSVKSDEEGIRSVYSGQLDGFITIYDATLPHITKSKYCNKLYLHHEYNNKLELGIALRKNLPISEDIVRTIRMYQEVRKLDYILNKWRYTPPCESSESESTSFTLEYGVGILMLVGCAALFCVVLLFLENFYSYSKEKNRHIYATVNP